MNQTEAEKTMSYLANELRKAHEIAASQHHIIQKLRAENARLVAELNRVTDSEGGAD